MSADSKMSLRSFLPKAIGGVAGVTGAIAAPVSYLRWLHANEKEFSKQTKAAEQKQRELQREMNTTMCEASPSEQQAFMQEVGDNHVRLEEAQASLNHIQQSRDSNFLPVVMGSTSVAGGGVAGAGAYYVADTGPQALKLLSEKIGPKAKA